MDSLQWVDQTYAQKHKADDPNTLRAMYYPNLRLYPTHGDTSKHHAPMEAAFAFLKRYGRRAGISLAIYLLSYLPLVGRFVLPAASFWTFNRAVGPVPATVIFGAGVLVPRRWLVVFLQSYFSSRALMRELVSEEAKRSFPFVRIPSAELATTFILVGNFLMVHLRLVHFQCTRPAFIQISEPPDYRENLLTLCRSSNPTSPGSDSPRSKSGGGSATEKGFSSASAWASTSS